MKNMTLGELGNMRRQLIAARAAFGDHDHGTPGFVGPRRPQVGLDLREQAVLDMARILERLLESL